MARFSTIALIALPLSFAFAVQGFASARDARANLRAARAELDAMEQVVYRVHPSMRSELLSRIDRVDRLLDDTARELPVDGASAQAFDIAYTRVAREDFDSNRMPILRALAGQRFTSEQVKQLVSLLDFESNKVDALTMFHASVVDPQRYPLIFDVLDFPSSRRELELRLGYAR